MGFFIWNLHPAVCCGFLLCYGVRLFLSDFWSRLLVSIVQSLQVTPDPRSRWMMKWRGMEEDADQWEASIDQWEASITCTPPCPRRSPLSPGPGRVGAPPGSRRRAPTSPACTGTARTHTYRARNTADLEIHIMNSKTLTSFSQFS